MQLIATDGRGQILLVIFLRIAFNRCGLVSADGVFLIPIDLVGLLASDVDILIPSYICFLTVAIVLLHHASHILGLGASDFVQLIAADGRGQITGGVVHDILCIVCDGAFLSGIGDIELILLCRGLTVFTLDGFIISLCRIDGTIGILTIFIFQIGLVFAGGLARIGAISLRIFDFGIDTICLHIRAGFCPVGRVAPLRIGFATLFRMGKLALRGHTVLFHLSVMSDTVCGNRSRAIMNRTIRVRLLVFHSDLVRLELALDFEILIHGHLIFEYRFAFHGQCTIHIRLFERGLFIDTERAIDRGILEISIAAGHVQTFIHIRRCIEIRGSVYRHRVRPIRRAEGDVAFKVGCASHIERATDGRIACGVDGFSRQSFHATHIPASVHGHFVFDGGLGVFCVPFNSAGPIIGGLQFFIQRGQILGNRISILHIFSSRIIDVSDLRIDFRICLCSCLSFFLQCSVGLA